MNGVDKITQNILSEAKELAKITILQAEKQRDSEVSKAAEDARLKADAKVERAKKEALELCERAKSTSSLERRKQILQAKREVINEVFDRIELSFMQMDTDSYTNLLIKMASSDTNGGIPVSYTHL